MEVLAGFPLWCSLHFFMRTGVVLLCLRHVALRVLHKLGLGVLTAEAVSLAIDFYVSTPLNVDWLTGPLVRTRSLPSASEGASWWVQSFEFELVTARYKE